MMARARVSGAHREEEREREGEALGLLLAAARYW
jgi:hypothetical protein